MSKLDSKYMKGKELPSKEKSKSETIIPCKIDQSKNSISKVKNDSCTTEMFDCTATLKYFSKELKETSPSLKF